MRFKCAVAGSGWMLRRQPLLDWCCCCFQKWGGLLLRLLLLLLLRLLLWCVCAQVVIMGDGQATQGDFVVKPNVKKVRQRSL
jgi:hypothetical protein